MWCALIGVFLWQDFILFPGEVEFKRVNQCTTGRVFMLKFHDRPDRKYFYWMQEPKDTRDEELRKKVSYSHC